MTTYKLLKIKNGKLYPLFVDTKTELVIGEWLNASIGELADEKHVKSKLGPLALRPGFHSTEVPFTNWIGKKVGDELVQRKDTVWCECEVEGTEEEVIGRYGLKRIPSDWYYYKTRPNQPFPWIISNRILIKRIISNEEVQKICRENGVEAQKVEI